MTEAPAAACVSKERNVDGSAHSGDDRCVWIARNLWSSWLGMLSPADFVIAISCALLATPAPEAPPQPGGERARLETTTQRLAGASGTTPRQVRTALARLEKGRFLRVKRSGSALSISMIESSLVAWHQPEGGKGAA